MAKVRSFSILESVFLEEKKRSPTRQPFHFNFGGKIRVNPARGIFYLSKGLKLAQKNHIPV